MNFKEENKSDLRHYGILGMKWGVRRSDAQLARGRRNTASEDYTESRRLKEKGVQNLSTKELKELTNRLQLEKQYKDLNPTDIKRGLNRVKSITAAATTVASLYAVTKTPLGQDIIKAVKSRVKK